ncbi:hypothetical protein DPEC_G00090930 [Dallia pectoralis]|uniref:Uncharacterized protein n=1 Tax=Dallia pectoralis TaxID=75939 RepID=A0ACC2H117_DALPE|nr:hypothetical protein DPEC_G00090930 [Dallia pectoralis]
MTRPEPGISCDLATCPLVCGAVFHSCKGAEHRLLCPLERVPCLNSGFGCPATLVRNQMHAHLEVCPAGVVCCTMEWNRWPISCLDYTSYESLSWGVGETEQLDMALALQDQHTLIESLKVVAMAPSVNGPVVAAESEEVVNDPVDGTCELLQAELPLSLTSPPAALLTSPPAGLLTAPPAALLTAPPASLLTAPPAALLTSPPAGLLTAPPASLLTAPPAALLTAPPASLLTAPPASLLTAPPASLLTAPPASLLTAPPASLLTAPPAALLTSPPAGLLTAPPAALLTAPPASLLTAPPAALLTAPPASLLTAPPASLLTAPPAALLTAPPAALLTAPPAALLTAPPAALLTAPPAALLTSPPAALLTSPPAALLTAQSYPLALAKDKIANGINGLNEERYSKLYEATVETARSLAAALDILSSAKSCSDNSTDQRININSGAVLDPLDRMSFSDRHNEPLPQNMLEVRGPEAEGADVNECFGPLHQLHQATVQLRKSLVTALGDLGNTVKYTDPISGIPFHPQMEPNSISHQSEVLASTDFELGVVSKTGGEAEMEGVAHVDTQMELLDWSLMSVEEMGGQSLSNGFMGNSAHKRPGDQAFGSDSIDQQQPGTSWCSSEGACPVKVLDDLSPLHVSHFPTGPPTQQCQPHPAPPLALPPHIHQGITHRASHVEDRGLRSKFQNHQMLISLGQSTLSNGRRVRVRLRPKMVDKSVDTSDLDQGEDPMGLGEIDLITAALLFCLEESRKCRRISDTTYVDGFHVDFGTQTFTFPAAILVTSTRVGDVASAAACDHALQLSYPSPFRTLRLDLVLEEVPQIRNIPCNRLQQMFSFVCGQLFRRDEYSSHFKNVHEDIHAGLNGWMEHRCPLAYYGCTYSQRRFCPSTQGSKVIHDRNLRSFGVQPCPVEGVALGESQADQFSGLPFEVLQHMARFLDSFSLCQLSMVSRTMRDVCASLLQSRGIVELRWERRQYPNGTFSWQIKDRVWRFSTAFSSVSEWRFTEVSSMSDHLRKCRYNTIERKMEAVPLPSMCTARDRSLLSVLKLQEQHRT